MKKIIVTFTLFFCAFAFAQNESSGSIATTITTPGPISGETFRFGPGIATQLDSGSGFGFTNDRWFSLGRLFTGSQTVYGLRFQLPNRAATFGYQDLNDANPRIQWIGSSGFAGSDLEFRTSGSFTSTASTLVATMTDQGSTFFGNPLGTTETKVGIDYSDVSSFTRTGLTVENNLSTPNYFTIAGIKSLNKVFCNLKTGVLVESDGGAFASTGVRVSVMGGTYNIGVSSSVQSKASGGSTSAVNGSISGPSGTTPTGFGAAIQGFSQIATNRYAGYFNGNVFTTGSYLPSDERLKTNIKEEMNSLSKLAQLDVVTYNFKENKYLNLPPELQHGFVAQNLEKVFPELLTTISQPILDENHKEIAVNEFKAVNYIGMISILTSSLKELDQQSKESIAQLKAESAAQIAQLQEESEVKMTALNEKIEALEAQISALTGEETPINPALSTQNNELGFSMEQNRPNPFANQTVINYTLPSNTKATISVVDLSGKFVKEYQISSVKGQLTINSYEIGKGIFVYAHISNDEVIMTKKMIVR
ncbi:MAG: tail fiber domain-containing protein [Bacteroidota bacterium]